MNPFVMTGETGWVSFPKILPNTGLKFNVNEVALEIGSFEIRWYGIIICAGVVLCFILGSLACEKHGLKLDDLYDYFLFAIPAAIIGARLYYVVFYNFSYYLENPKEIFDYSNGGLAVYGGIIAAVIAIFCVAKYKKQSFLKVMDFGMPYILLGQAIGRWGNLVNQEAFGGKTTLPWGMTGNKIEEFVSSQGWEIGTLVHPTFLYESLWCLAAFIFIMIYRKKFYKATGELVCLYMITYGLGRLWIEGLRTDSLMVGPFRVSQLLSLLIVIIGTTLLIDFRRRWKEKVYEEGSGEEHQSELAGVISALQAIEEEEESAAAQEIEANLRQEDELSSYEESNLK